MSQDDKINKILESLQLVVESNRTLEQRLGVLEAEKTVKQEGGTGQGGVSSSGIREVVSVQMGGREKALTVTFGENDCSASSLRLFLDHFNLAVEQNLQKEVKGWDDSEFRARELRLQIRGEPALWLSSESAMLKVWLKDDKEIIKRLKERYMGTQSLELNIISFEDLHQNEGETLAQYMTRCQLRGFEAFGAMQEPRSTQQRIVWKFLSGIRDND